MTAEPGAPVEIVAVGRELLTGRTPDANSAWLGVRIPAFGGRVTRVVIVDDDPAVIAREIRQARANGAALVVTTGGLGPTNEDRTLAGVAAALGRPLREHPGALAAVARRYAALAGAGAAGGGELTPARRKMATLPEGAEFIDNPLGTAPAVFASTATFAILALPGTPDEVHVLVDAAAARIASRLGTAVYHAERELASGCGDESRLTTIAERVMTLHPGVHVTSVPTAPDSDVHVRVTATGTTPIDAEQRVAAATTALAAMLPGLKE